MRAEGQNGSAFRNQQNNIIQSWIFYIGQNQLRWNVLLLKVWCLQTPVQSLYSFSFLGSLSFYQNIYMNCILLSRNSTLIHILWSSHFGGILYFCTSFKYIFHYIFNSFISTDLILDNTFLWILQIMGQQNCCRVTCWYWRLSIFQAQQYTDIHWLV